MKLRKQLSICLLSILFFEGVCSILEIPKTLALTESPKILNEKVSNVIGDNPSISSIHNDSTVKTDKIDKKLEKGEKGEKGEETLKRELAEQDSNNNNKESRLYISKNNARINGVQATKTPTSESPFTVSGGTITGYDATLGGTNVVIPESINGTTITTIGQAAFLNKGITSVTIPNTVTRISQLAFANNSALSNVQLSSNLTTIAMGAFRNCGLTNVVIPDSVTTIEKQAFADGKLTTVKIGTSLKTINSRAFAGNQISTIDFSNVETIEEEAFMGNNFGELTLPNALTTIERSAFFKSNIHTIRWGNNIKSIGANAFDYNQIKKLTVTAEKIGNAAFNHNPLEEVTLADSVKVVEANAFIGDNDNPTLKKIDLGQGVESIGNSAFSNGLVESLQLPASLKTIGSNVFGYQQLPFIKR